MTTRFDYEPLTDITTLEDGDAVIHERYGNKPMVVTGNAHGGVVVAVLAAKIAKPDGWKVFRETKPEVTK